MIDPKSVSYEEILQDLKEYVESQGESWKDFFETSTGQILLELLAGVGSFLLTKTYFARREAYLHQAKITSSAISIAEGLSYPVFRGYPPKVVFQVSSDEVLTLNKYSVIGYVGDYDIILSDDLVVNAGETKKFYAYIGKYVEEEKTISFTSETQKYIFLRFLTQVSEIFDFEVNGTKADYSLKVRDLKEKWLLLTNQALSIDAFYLNLNDTYSEGDKAKIKGIYFDYKTDSFEVNDIIFYDNRFTPLKVEKPIKPDSLKSIQVIAPYYADTSLIVRAREDYKKLFLIKFPYLRDAVSHDKENKFCIVQLSYLKEDLTSLSDEEKQEFLDFVDQLRPMGIPLPEIIDPEEIQVNLTFKIRLSRTVDTSLIKEAVESCIEKFSKKLGKDLDLYEMEFYLEENYDFIKIARVVNNTSGYTVNWNSYIKVNNYSLEFF